LTDVASSWIEHELQRFILEDIHWHCYQIIQDEMNVVREIMRKANDRTSIRDVWGIAVGEISLFYYTATLATWFFDLNLVRFEHTEHGGKRLMII